MAAIQSLLRRDRLWTFHGGIHVPDEKALSNGRAVEVMPLPKRLVIPLQQHIGATARPVAKVGDRVLKGQLLAQAEGYVSACIHASSSGTLVAIEPHPVPHPSGLSALCAVIETDGEDTWAELPEPITHYAQLDPTEIRERIRWAGVVGLGGASFPTSVKLNPGPDQRIRTLIINGAECEPYITCDDLLMRERAGDILAGVRIMHHLLGDPRIAEQVMHDSHTREDISGALAHQQIVAGDVGLAFGPVDDQCADALIRAGVELDAGRKRGAAESDHAGPTDALANLGRVQLRVMGYRLGQLGPGVLAVGLDHGAERGEPGRVRDRMRLDRNQGSRARGMDTGADIAFGLRQQLSFENSVAHLRHRPRGRPDVLLQRDHEALGQRHDLHGAAVGERLLVGHMDPAVERPQAIAAQE